MGWKKWPSWVKGGIMGLIISIFLVVLFFVDVVQNGGSSLISQMIVNLCEFYTRCNNYSGDPAFAGYKCVFCIIGGPAYLGLTLIILGIIIGLIIGKIRKK